MKKFNQHITNMALHLNLNEDHIYNLFLDSAEEFLNDYAGNARAAQIWKATPEFWAWWKQVWIWRDKIIQKRYPNGVHERLKNDMYAIWHSPKYLDMRPNSVVYDGFVRTMKQKQILLKEIA